MLMTCIYIYAFSRCFYPKPLTVHSGYLFLSVVICVPRESNPQPFALLTQCSTTEPQEHKCWIIYKAETWNHSDSDLGVFYAYPYSRDDQKSNFRTVSGQQFINETPCLGHNVIWTFIFVQMSSFSVVIIRLFKGYKTRFLERASSN